MKSKNQIFWLLISALLGAQSAYALPQGAQVVQGSATFASPNSSTLNVTNSNNAIINWQKFNIGAGQTTHFIQPSSASSVLNRVISNNPSQILGNLNSNGQVYLINQHGILVGEGARINTNGFFASTLNITNEDFLNGNLKFSEGGFGDIDNTGYIHAGEHGNVVLIAPNIENGGVIEVDNGNIILAAGQSITITSLDNSSVEFQVQSPDNKITNLGSVIANNGAANLFAGSLKHTGSIRATGLVRDENGIIRLVALDKNEVSGSVDVTGEQGGYVEILGDTVEIQQGANIDASGTQGGGEILIGGDQQGLNPEITNATSTTIASGAEVHADATETGNGGRVIAFAQQDIHIHGAMTARGGAMSGDGGFIETSGLKWLDITYIPDASAVNGVAGQWLIDPYNIEIISGIGSDDSVFTANPSAYASSADTTTLDVSVINTALTAGTNVSIETGSGGGSGSGDITISAAISISPSGPVSLTLNALNDIYINADIKSTGATLNLNLNSDFDGDSSGGSVLTGAEINTNGGVLTLGSPMSLSTGVVTLESGATINGDLTVGSGSTLNINGTSFTNNGVLTVNNGGVISLAQSSGMLGTGTLTIGTGSTFSVSSAFSLASAATFSLEGGEVSLIQNLTLPNSFDWLYGTVSGTTLTTAAGVTTTLASASTEHQVLNANWDNYGLVDWVAVNTGGDVYVNDGFTLSNYGTFQNATSGYIYDSNIGAGTGAFINYGDFDINTSNAVRLFIDVTNEGNFNLNVNNAQFTTFYADFVSNGAINFNASGTSFNLSNQADMTLNAGSTFGGTNAGAFYMTSSLSILDVAGAVSLGTTNLIMYSGEITNAQNLTVGNSFKWAGGTISGTGTFITDNSVTTELGSASDTTLNIDWTNNGIVNWVSSGGDFVINNNFTNFSFNINDSSSASEIKGTGLFTNSGNVSVLSSAEANGTIAVDFINNGTIDFDKSGYLLYTTGSFANFGNLNFKQKTTFNHSGGASAFTIGAGAAFNEDINGALSLFTILQGSTLDVASSSYTFDSDLNFGIRGSVTNAQNLNGHLPSTVYWNSGTISGTGSLTIPNTTTLSIQPLYGDIILDNFTLNTNGTASVRSVDNGNRILLNNGALWNNNGTLNIQDTFTYLDVDIESNAGIAGTLNNYGTINSAATTVDIQTDFYNVSDVNIQSGTMNVYGQTDNIDGTINISSGALFSVGSGTMVFDWCGECSGPFIKGAGEISIESGATADFQYSTDMANTITFTLNGGTVDNINNLGVNGSTFNLFSGVINGTAFSTPSNSILNLAGVGNTLTLNVGTSTIDFSSSTINWLGGTINGTSSMFTSTVGAVFTLGDSSRIIDNVLDINWTNHAHVDWVSSGGDFVVNSTFTNGTPTNLGVQARTFSVKTTSNDADITGTGQFINNAQPNTLSGTPFMEINAAATSTDLDITAQFASYGDFTIGKSGYSVNLSGGSQLSGQIDIASGSQLTIDGVSTATLVTAGAFGVVSPSFAGNGTLFVQSGSTLDFAVLPTSFANSLTLSLNGGTISNAQNLTLPNTFNWNGGTVSGTSGSVLTVASTATMNLTSGMLNTISLLNTGTINWQGASNAAFSLNSNFGNSASGVINIFDNAQARFVGLNSGLANKTLSLSGGTFVNNGAINLADSTLDLGGMTLALNSATSSLNGSGIVIGDVVNTLGTVLVTGGSSAGSLTVDGSYTQGDGGALAIRILDPINGNFQYDSFAVTGLATLSGELNISYYSNQTVSITESFNPFTFSSRDGIFTSIVDSNNNILAIDFSNGGFTILGTANSGTTSALQEILQNQDEFEKIIEILKDEELDETLAFIKEIIEERKDGEEEEEEEERAPKLVCK